MPLVPDRTPLALWSRVAAFFPFVVIALLLAACGLARAGDMATVEQRIISEVMQSLPTDANVTYRLDTLGATGLWPNLTYDKTSTTDPHLQYMRDLARAYRSPASTHHNSAALRDKFLLAFDACASSPNIRAPSSPD